MSADNAKNQADFDWALGLNRLTLRFIGVWPDVDVKEQQFIPLLLRVPLMILIIFLFLLLPQTYALLLVIHELPLVIDNLFSTWTAFACCIKFFYMWKSEKVLKPVIKSITRDWLRTKSEWEHKAMKRQAFRARLFTMSGFVIVFGAYSGFAFAPLFGLNMRIITNITDRGDRYLSVQAAYPYDYSRSPIFEMMELSQIISGFFIALSLSIPDNYFGALVFHASGQFQILGYQIQNFYITDAFNSNTSIEFYQQFRVFCDRHVHLLSVVAKLEKSFCFILATQVLSTTVTMVCLGFQVQHLLNSSTDKESLIRLLTLIASLATVLLHTFVDCFASETLFNYNSGIFHNLYHNSWYLIQNHNIRILIPMMIIAGKTKPLTAGKIFDLSLQSYCSLLKTSVGYISMLIAVNAR